MESASIFTVPATSHSVICELVAQNTVDAYEDRLVLLVQAYGEVPAGAEKSKRLAGQLTELTVTTGSTISLKQAAVGTLQSALYANGQGPLFGQLFAQQVKYELVKGAATALRIADLPKRLAEKVLRMFAACFDVKTKSPSLKVKRLADKPAKKARSGKAAA